jgi:hypothetical protein
MTRFRSPNRPRTRRSRPATRTAATVAVAFAALAAGQLSGVRESRALAGSEAWCIVTDEGNNRCNFATSQECLQAVANGDHGFCNVNSSAASAAAPQPERRKARTRSQ